MLNFNAIQVGTNKGYDNFFSIVSSYHPERVNSIVLVEPFDHHNQSISKCYENYVGKFYIENIIVTPNHDHNKQEKIWYHEHDGTHLNAYELASLNPKHATKIRGQYLEEDMRHLSLDCLTVNELCDKYNLSHLNILYLDAEGYDDKIIYSIDFDRLSIDSIYFEILHLSDRHSLETYLRNIGYQVKECDNDPYANLAYKE